MKKDKPTKKKKVIKKVKAATKGKALKKKKVVKKAKALKKTSAPKKTKVVAAKKRPVKKVKTLKKVTAPKKAAAPKKEKTPITPAIQDLQTQNVKFTLHPYQYEEPGGTQQSASKLGVDEHIVIKTLVMEDENGKPLIILMHGDKEVATDALATITGAQTIAPCQPEVAEGYTGYQVGGTSPFGIKKVIPLFMESTIADLPKIYINAGRRGLLAQMSPGELIQVLKPFTVNVAV